MITHKDIDSFQLVENDLQQTKEFAINNIVTRKIYSIIQNFFIVVNRL